MTIEVDKALVSQDNYHKALGASGRNANAEQFLITSVSKNGETKVDGVRKKLLADFLIEENHILVAPNIFYRYHEGIYESGNEGFINVMIESILGEYGTITVKREIVAHIRDSAKIQINIDKVTLENKYLIGFNNGVYNWKNGKFTLHSPENFLSSKLNVDYNPNAKSVHAIQMIKNVFGDDLEDELEYIGYALTSTNWLDKIAFYVGDGKNGKTFYFEWLAGLFGHNNCCHTSPHDLANDKFAAVDLVGKHACIVADIGNEKIPGFNRMKQFSTIDMVRFRDVAEKAYFARLFAKFFYGCNDLPYISDKSYGSTRRQRIVVLKRIFSKDDADYDADILTKSMTDEEYSGVINLALEALTRLSKRGDFLLRDNIAAFSHDLSRVIFALVDDCFLITGIDKEKILTSEVVEINEKWCKMRGFPIPDRDSFVYKFLSKFATKGLTKKQTSYKGVVGTYFLGMIKTTPIEEVVRNYGVLK